MSKAIKPPMTAPVTAQAQALWDIRERDWSLALTPDFNVKGDGCVDMFIRLANSKSAPRAKVLCCLC
jgi:hypothetical protein